MKNLLSLSLGLLAFIHVSSWAEISLDHPTDYFEGDPLNEWTDPQDERFKNRDLKGFFSNKFNTQIRQEIYNLRQSYIAKFAKIYNQPNADYISLQKHLTNDLMNWTAQHVLAAKPKTLKDKDYTFVAFGSAGRLESGIVTDLEGGLIFSNDVPHPAQIGLEFGNKLGEILNGLIGHPLYGRKGYRLDEQSNAPAHYSPFVDNKQSLGEILCPMINAYGMAKNSTEKSFWGVYYYPFEGSNVLATTVDNLAEYARGITYNIPQIFQLRVNASARNQPWYKWASRYLVKDSYSDENFLKEHIKNSSCGGNLNDASETMWARYFADVNQTNELKVVSAFADIGRNHYFVAGNKELYDAFVVARNKVLDDNNGEVRQKIVAANFREIITKWSYKKYGGEMFILGKLPTSGVFDIKRHNYRLVEQFLTAMQVRYSLKAQNQADIIDELVKMDIFGKEFSESLLDVVNHLTKLRWLSQIKVKGQLEASLDFLTPAAYASKLASLEASKKSELAKLKAAAPTSLASLMAKSNLADINSALEQMPFLEPLKKDSVLNQDEISYLANVIVPVQSNLFNRIVAYMGNPNNINFPPNPNAFKDDFCTINFSNYGVSLRQ